MNISDKIKILLKYKGLKQKDLAPHFGMSEAAIRNKFARGSFSADDLILIAEIAGAPLGFEVGSGTRVTFDKGDIRPDKERE